MQTEPRCPHCNEVVEQRWDVCRHCGKPIRVLKPAIPGWVWPLAAILFIGVAFVTGRELLKGGVGSCKGSDKPGCSEALQVCTIANRHVKALEQRSGPVSAVLPDAQRAESLAKVARSKGGVRYTALPIYAHKLVVALSRPDARLPLKNRERIDYRYLRRTCEAIL